MKSMKRMVRGSSFFPLAQVSAALLFFLALSSSTEAGAPRAGCCPGTEMCEYASMCFDDGFVWDGWKCVVELSECDWVPVPSE